MGACERVTAWLDMLRFPQHPPRSYQIDLLVIGFSIIYLVRELVLFFQFINQLLQITT